MIPAIFSLDPSAFKLLTFKHSFFCCDFTLNKWSLVFISQAATLHKLYRSWEEDPDIGFVMLKVIHIFYEFYFNFRSGSYKVSHSLEIEITGYLLTPSPLNSPRPLLLSTKLWWSIEHLNGQYLRYEDPNKALRTWGRNNFDTWYIICQSYRFSHC